MLAGCPAPCGFAGDEAGLASHHARGSEAKLSVLRRMPDVQNFNGIAFYAIGDDMWQPPVQEFRSSRVPSSRPLRPRKGNFFSERADLRISITVGRAK